MHDRPYDPRLGRFPEFDVRSKDFPIIEAIDQRKPRGYTWRLDAFLDQGREGACVGFAWAHELIARPLVAQGINVAVARRIYRQAQKIDQWPGEHYEGTSVIAGAKVCQGAGYFAEYRWAFSLHDLILAVGYAGPVVLGVNWYEGMEDVDADGYLHVSGQIVGGHAILCHAVNVQKQYFTLHNSWGPNWGLRGRARIRFADLERLLHEDGEACIPLRRAHGRPILTGSPQS